AATRRRRQPSAIRAWIERAELVACPPRDEWFQLRGDRAKRSPPDLREDMRESAREKIPPASSECRLHPREAICGARAIHVAGAPAGWPPRPSLCTSSPSTWGAPYAAA